MNSDAAGGSLINIKVGWGGLIHLGVVLLPIANVAQGRKCGMWTHGVPLTSQLQLLELCRPLINWRLGKLVAE